MSVTDVGSSSSCQSARESVSGSASSSCCVITTSPLCELVERNRSVPDVLVSGADQLDRAVNLSLRDRHEMTVQTLAGRDRRARMRRDRHGGQFQPLPLFELQSVAVWNL